jgi:hypothetical protein
MKPEINDFDVFPRIVPVGKETTITIRPLYDQARLDPAKYRVVMHPSGGLAREIGSPSSTLLDPEWIDGGLRFCYRFEREQEYVVSVEDISDAKRPRSYEFRLYALEDDLCARRPYKGDIHIHSFRSDGRESPAYVAAACRRIGMDFMAVTDHRLYTPSLEAIRAFEGLPVDLRIYPGEEVHPPDNPVHIINFGGSFSVNEIFQKDEARYRAEVQVIADGLENFPPGGDRYSYASCDWSYRQIRAGGGLSLFCHPYWFTRHRYDVPDELVDQLFARQPWDALELIGGYHLYEVESNLIQVARYHDERAKGKQVPVVGVSDAHGCERDLFGWYYTIDFSPSLDLPDLVRSIKDLYSVAIEALPGQEPRAHGPFRLVRYAQFLLREIFPLHDALCHEEGRLMLAHITGEPQAAQQLSVLQGRTAALYDRLF